MDRPSRRTGILRWWRLPFWTFALFTGAKSFADNPIIGSRRLNRAGLHVWRVKAAHALARSRRRRLARLLPAELREQFDREFAINVRAPFFITQRALPLIRDGGHIINISSGVTWFATPQIVYSMTKGALNVMGRALFAPG
jgi:NAD(P)-dependent dehydrogenase (short-subunit alcohol dehydrogenase family)